MKVYLHDEDIPKCCGECPYGRTVKRICFFTGKISHMPWKERPSYCPIVRDEGEKAT